MRLASAVFATFIQYPKKCKEKKSSAWQLSFFSTTMQMNGEMNAKKQQISGKSRRNHLTFKFGKFYFASVSLFRSFFSSLPRILKELLESLT